MVIPSYVASARPRQLRGPAFQEWYSTHHSVSNLDTTITALKATSGSLTKRAVGDALPVLFEPSVRVEDGGVFSPDFRHPSENIVLIADDVASVWGQSGLAQLLPREEVERTS
jgi:hypothetical protein